MSQAEPLSTALEPQAISDFERLLQGNKLSYVPSGESEPISISVPIAKRFFVKPTKRGAMPSDEQVTQFVMTCHARALNPWLGDVWLVGYDGNDGPEYSLITSVNALHKRAAKTADYDGLSAGVVIEVDGEIREVEGECYPSRAVLVGGWCRVHRKDKGHAFYAAVRLSAYNKGRSLWKNDQGGMIRKCAVAKALREAFPLENSGLYTSDELPAMMAAAQSKMVSSQSSTLSDAAAKAKEDLARMMNQERNPAEQSHEPEPEPQYLENPGDDIAADAALALGEQTPAPAPESPKYDKPWALEQMRKKPRKSVGAWVAHCATKGLDISAEADEYLKSA